MFRSCNEHIRTALEMARKLTILADDGEAEMEDDGCGVLYGVVRDCAYRIRAEAEREREAHQVKGVWEDHDPSDVADSGPISPSVDMEE
ncbi:hypothetical protein ACFL1X_14615 [Candidatus Hydrogenedentota bacterium]